MIEGRGKIRIDLIIFFNELKEKYFSNFGFNDTIFGKPEVDLENQEIVVDYALANVCDFTQEVEEEIEQTWKDSNKIIELGSIAYVVRGYIISRISKTMLYEDEIYSGIYLSFNSATEMIVKESGESINILYNYETEMFESDYFFSIDAENYVIYTIKGVEIKDSF